MAQGGWRYEGPPLGGAARIVFSRNYTGNPRNTGPHLARSCTTEPFSRRRKKGAITDRSSTARPPAMARMRSVACRSLPPSMGREKWFLKCLASPSSPCGTFVGVDQTPKQYRIVSSYIRHFCS